MAIVGASKSCCKERAGGNKAGRMQSGFSNGYSCSRVYFQKNVHERTPTRGERSEIRFQATAIIMGVVCFPAADARKVTWARRVLAWSVRLEGETDSLLRAGVRSAPRLFMTANLRKVRGFHFAFSFLSFPFRAFAFAFLLLWLILDGKLRVH